MQEIPCFSRKPTDQYLHISLTLASVQWSVPFQFSVQILNTFPISLRHTTCPIQLIHPDLIISVFGKWYLSRRSSLFTFLHSPVTSSLLGPNILTSTLFSTPRSVLKLTDKILQTHKTRGKIIYF